MHRWAIALLLSGCQGSVPAAPSREPIAISSVPSLNVVMARPEPKWTCAAYCVSEYHCTDNGQSTSSTTTITSEGESAAAAFLALAKQCKGAHADLIVHGDCRTGKWQATGASISTSCAR